MVTYASTTETHTRTHERRARSAAYETEVSERVCRLCLFELSDQKVTLGQLGRASKLGLVAFVLLPNARQQSAIVRAHSEAFSILCTRQLLFLILQPAGAIRLSFNIHRTLATAASLVLCSPSHRSQPILASHIRSTLCGPISARHYRGRSFYRAALAAKHGPTHHSRSSTRVPTDSGSPTGAFANLFAQFGTQL